MSAFWLVGFVFTSGGFPVFDLRSHEIVGGSLIWRMRSLKIVQGSFLASILGRTKLCRGRSLLQFEVEQNCAGVVPCFTLRSPKIVLELGLLSKIQKLRSHKSVQGSLLCRWRSHKLVQGSFLDSVRARIKLCSGRSSVVCSRVAAPKFSGLFYNFFITYKNRKQNRFNSRESINGEF